MTDTLNSRVLLEVCIDDAAGLAAAAAGGADRVELCSALSVGGLTPSVGLMHQSKTMGMPGVAMIRPRAGDFCFGPDEVAIMLEEVALVRDVGLQGVVLGAANPDGTLDMETLSKLCEAAGSMETCLHRVFDLTPDPFVAVDQAVELGFSRILTTGQAQSVYEGLDLLIELKRHAGDRISILPGGGINRTNAGEIVRTLGIHEIHSSCTMKVDGFAPELVQFGFAPDGPRKVIDPELVGEMRRMLAMIAALGESEAAKADAPGAA